MKTEIVNIPGKGICILISEIDVKEFLQGVDGAPTLKIYNSPFTNIQIIAYEIRNGRRIGAIKEVREQTNWDLRKSKEYIDKFMPIGEISYHDDDEVKEQYYNRCAFKFLSAHERIDFINDDEFKI
jgi:hypothetical protein